MPISCHLYDSIEIVCMYQYPVTLTLRDTQELTGVALDTKLNAQKQECIELAITGQSTLVALSQLKTMRVNVDNPHLTLVNFTLNS